MNYEELYRDLNPLQKELKEAVGSAVRQQKSLAKSIEAGNLTEARKIIPQIMEAAGRIQNMTDDISGIIDHFDTKAYLLSGDFTRQMLDACKDAGIDVKGEKGVYEMFPYKVRIVGDEDHAEEIWINRKKHASVRPKALAETIRAGQEKLYKASFNDTAFMNELAEAYDTACLKSGARIGSYQALTKVYKALTPMARARKEYDMQAFAFDLARIYEKGPDGMPRTASSKLNNPAYLYRIYYRGELLGMNVLMPGEEVTIDEYTVRFDNPRNYTLLAVKRDRFTFLVLLGGLITLAGLILAFWMQPRAVWAVREETGWHIYGTNRKGGALFREEFSKAASAAGFITEDTDRGGID